ncbi:hypothetical protein V6N11_053985 [Hibiscus sabdariffa]|uniref:Uncharacterized protein n=1 Tax=Hibiscus sabdariffa TaxID=183260 RepID=A0ABR2S3H0_9ROSI
MEPSNKSCVYEGIGGSFCDVPGNTLIVLFNASVESIGVLVTFLLRLLLVLAGFVVAARLSTAVIFGQVLLMSIRQRQCKCSMTGNKMTFVYFEEFSLHGHFCPMLQLNHHALHDTVEDADGYSYWDSVHVSKEPHPEVFENGNSDDH